MFLTPADRASGSGAAADRGPSGLEGPQGIPATSAFAGPAGLGVSTGPSAPPGLPVSPSPALPGQAGHSGRSPWLAAPLGPLPAQGSALPRRVARVGPQVSGILQDIITEAEVGLAQASVRSGGCFTRPLPLDETCAKAARSFFREAVSGAGLPADLIHDGVTMASELAANTMNAHANIEFGEGHRPVSGMPEFWLYLRTAGSGREIVCKIFDSEPGWDAGEPVPVGAAVPAGPDSVRGRGLQMVAGLSAGRWGHHPSRGRVGSWKVSGKAVWFALRVPPASDLAHSARIAPQGWRAIGEIAAALADRGVGAGLVQVAEPGGGLAVLSVRQQLTVWCGGDVLWWREPDGGYDRLCTSDLVEVIERIVWAHEELAARPPDQKVAAPPADADEASPMDTTEAPKAQNPPQRWPGGATLQNPPHQETGFDPSI